MVLRDIVRRVRAAFRRGEPAAETVELRDEFANRAGESTADLARRLAAKEITLREFQAAVFAETRSAFVAQYALGKGGGGVANLTDTDRGVLEEMLGRQLGYLRDFTRQIATGTLTEAQIAQRAALYPEAAIEAHTRGEAAARGVVLPDTIPPAHARCRCVLRHDTEGGEPVVYWMTSEDERVCPQCTDLADQYNPWRSAA